MTQTALNPLAVAAEIANAQPGAQLPDDAVRWISDGLRRYLRGDGTLEQCLRLTGATRQRARNHALIRAAVILDDGRGIRPYPLSEMLEKAIRRFENLYPPHRREQTHIADMTPLNLAIYESIASGGRRIRTARNLYKELF
ncbi:MAG: hypothetical protein ABIG70_04905 [Pseudomonadota bacterium]